MIDKSLIKAGDVLKNGIFISIRHDLDYPIYINRFQSLEIEDVNKVGASCIAKNPIKVRARIIRPPLTSEDDFWNKVYPINNDSLFLLWNNNSNMDHRQDGYDTTGFRFANSFLIPEDSKDALKQVLVENALKSFFKKKSERVYFASVLAEDAFEKDYRNKPNALYE